MSITIQNPTCAVRIIENTADGEAFSERSFVSKKIVAVINRITRKAGAIDGKAWVCDEQGPIVPLVRGELVVYDHEAFETSERGMLHDELTDDESRMVDSVADALFGALGIR